MLPVRGGLVWPVPPKGVDSTSVDVEDVELLLRVKQQASMEPDVLTLPESGLA